MCEPKFGTISTGIIVTKQASHPSRVQNEPLFKGFPPTYTTRCPQCRYDLHGLPATHRCPECDFEYDAATIVWRPSKRKWVIHLLMAVIVTLVFILGFYDEVKSQAPVGIDSYPWRYPVFGVPLFIVGFILIRRGNVRYVAVTSEALVIRKVFGKSLNIPLAHVVRFVRTGKGYSSPISPRDDWRPNKSTVYDREMIDVVLIDPQDQSTDNKTYLLLGAGDKMLRRFVHLANRNVQRYRNAQND